MGYIKGIDRNQITLFPESLDEYISEDNVVRVIEAFVMYLDLQNVYTNHKGKNYILPKNKN